MKGQEKGRELESAGHIVTDLNSCACQEIAYTALAESYNLWGRVQKR